MSVLTLVKPFGKRLGKVWMTNEYTQKQFREEARRIPGSLATVLLGAFWHSPSGRQVEDESRPLNTHVDWLIGLNQGIRGR